MYNLLSRSPRIEVAALKTRFRPKYGDEFTMRFEGGECGDPIIQENIVGGELTELDEFPWMALLFYRRIRSDLSANVARGCGGVLINSQYTLTAAHCVIGTEDLGTL